MCKYLKTITNVHNSSLALNDMDTTSWMQLERSWRPDSNSLIEKSIIWKIRKIISDFFSFDFRRMVCNHANIYEILKSKLQIIW